MPATPVIVSHTACLFNSACCMWLCGSEGAAAFGSYIGASMVSSPTNPYLNMMISLSAATVGIVVAGGSSALPTFSATTGVAVTVGASFLYKIGEMIVKHTGVCSQAPNMRCGSGRYRRASWPCPHRLKRRYLRCADRQFVGRQ